MVIFTVVAGWSLVMLAALGQTALMWKPEPARSTRRRR